MKRVAIACSAAAIAIICAAPQQAAAHDGGGGFAAGLIGGLAAGTLFGIAASSPPPVLNKKAEGYTAGSLYRAAFHCSVSSSGQSHTWMRGLTQIPR